MGGVWQNRQGRPILIFVMLIRLKNTFYQLPSPSNFHVGGLEIILMPIIGKGAACRMPCCQDFPPKHDQALNLKGPSALYLSKIAWSPPLHIERLTIKKPFAIERLFKKLPLTKTRNVTLWCFPMVRSCRRWCWLYHLSIQCMLCRCMPYKWYANIWSINSVHS